MTRVRVQKDALHDALHEDHIAICSKLAGLT